MKLVLQIRENKQYKECLGLRQPIDPQSDWLLPLIVIKEPSTCNGAEIHRKELGQPFRIS